ncbi:hypothetical protein EST38_g3476 [Candolleomyces aberdarensis]|uniref:Uncharacterized protein n=1 Tax=Candolleomyces aberdarensis TaxID=2316362 RepID=A0A4Q2DTD5_9AGAR|nr:hypothetical protein EST38_g3476 [Candolleomyces aberdarensis]
MARSGVVPTKLEVVMPAKKVRWEESEQEEGEDEEDEEDEDEGDGDEGDEEEDEGHEQAGREHKDMEAQEDVLVQLLKHGVPLDDLGIKFSDTEGLECLLDSLGNSDASSDKPRPWDSIKSLSLSFENDCQPENPNTLKSLLLRLPKTITSFELCLPNNYTLSIEEPMSMEPVLQLPQKFAEKLTAFSISCEWGVQHMFRLLEHCANLEVLTLDFLSMDSQWMAEQYAEATGALKVNLPKLHTLRLRQSPPDIISVLWYLQAPVLVNLDFEFDDEGGYLDFGGEFLAFLTTESNCAPTLKSLRIAGIQWDAIDICDTLDELPALTHLALEGVCFDEDEDDILQNLEERCKPSTSHRHLDQPAPFLPNLKVLELIGIVGQKNFHHLVGFISSREQLFRTGAWSSKSFGSDGRLKALTVTCNKRLSPLDLDSRERKKLKRSGMVLNVFPRSTWP